MNGEGCSPIIMGILNITTDSFSDGNKYNDVEAAINHAMSMIDNGADIIDIGAESSRPGALPIDSTVELSKLLPVVNEIKKLKTLISVDTYKSVTAKKVLETGIDIINDIYALRFDADMVHVLKDFPKSKIVLMHMLDTPSTMQNNPVYNDVVQDIINFLKERIDYCLANGISEDRIIIDPGIGFGKTFEHNICIIKNIEKFKDLKLPVLLGASRKSFINSIYESTPQDRLVGSLATTVVAFMKKIDIIRVHDVKEHTEMIKSLAMVI